MKNKCVQGLSLLVLLSYSAVGMSQDWIQTSNEHSDKLLQILAQTSPESYASVGVEGYDEAITDLSSGFVERQSVALNKAKSMLEKALDEATHPAVKQDLAIMLGEVDSQLTGIALDDKYFIPYINVSQNIYNGLRNLLDARNSDAQHQAALVRLKKYVGATDGFSPYTELAQAYMTRHLQDAGKLGPVKEEVETHLSSSATMLAEIPELFEQYEIQGYQQAFEQLTAQLDTYHVFIREQVLPIAREDFRLPLEVYEHNLRQYGVDMPLQELLNRARTEYKQLQNNMQALAFQIADQRKWKDTDYRSVLKALKAEQIAGDKILPFYREKNAAIEDIIRRENILTLPTRDLNIRLASAAEAAQSPAPFMSPPRLIGNTGEVGEFVLPLSYPGAGDSAASKIDDFTYEASAWPLSAHEARPGHELQFAAMVEKGVSTARMLFAFNSVNVEGWALYAEEEIKPYLSLEGQFASNWSRLIRSARVFLDVGLNTGTIDRAQAERVLREELVLSEALARSEVERYMFRAPGQATSYFNGYSRLMEVRAETELLLGDKFDRKAFHDFILAQGLLPPALLKQALLNEFIPTQE